MSQTAELLPIFKKTSKATSGKSKLCSSLDFFIGGLSCDADWLGDEELARLESSGTNWIRFFYGKQYSRAFAVYQENFWRYIVELSALRAQKPDAKIQPRVECEPRGVGKSSNGRGGVVYLLAKKVKFYVLIVSATAGQAKKHFNAVKKQLENPKLLRHYPHLAPRVSKHRNSFTNWSADRIVTAAGQVIEFISILGNARGFNTEESLRPDLIVIDDIDDQKDSADVVEKKLDILGSNILGAGDETTDILFLQNLIHRISICTRLRDNTAGILLNRHFVGPFPLCKSFDYAEEKIKGDKTGAKQYVLTDFQPYDPATSREYVEILLNRLGPKRFERECQQNLNIIDDDKDFREYSEIHHAITYTEFARTFLNAGIHVWNEAKRRPQIPHNWNVGLGMDFGTTPEHPTAVFPMAKPNKAGILCEDYFTFGEVVLPKYPGDPNKPAELVSPRRVRVAESDHLKKWNVSNDQITIRRMSHEQSAARNAMFVDLEDDLKVFYNKWKAAKGGGVPQWQEILEIDYTKPHPFRKYPKNHPREGQPIIGKPKWYIVVPDDQGELLADDSGHLYVRQPINSDGAARLRAEIPVYNHRNTGKRKLFDDMVDAGRGLMGSMIIRSKEKTDDERYREFMQKYAPENLPERIAEVEDEDLQSILIASAKENRRIWEKEHNKPLRLPDDEFNQWDSRKSEAAEDNFGQEFWEL